METLLIALMPVAAVALLALSIAAFAGSVDGAWRRLLGRPSRVHELEERIVTLEADLKRARASELPIEIEAERLAEEIHQLEARRWDGFTGGRSTQHDEMDSLEIGRFEDLPEADSGDPGESETSVIAELPPEPDESDEDRVAREQLEAEERERLAQVAAEEARIREEREAVERQNRAREEAEARRQQAEEEERARIERERREEEARVEQARLEAEADRQREAQRIERERREEEARVEQARLDAEAERKREAERVERERLEAEAARWRDQEQQRKTEEFRRRVADATPKIVMSAGGSNRQGATINVAVTNSLTPKHAEIAILSASWARDPARATFEKRRKDGLFEERWPKHSLNGGPLPAWGTYEDASGRSFTCPGDAPTDTQVWIVISYDRTVGGPASTWQRFEVGGAGALWYVRQPVGDPILIEAARDDDEDQTAA